MYSKKFTFITIALFVLLLIGDVFSQQYIRVRITWDTNTESDLAGYKVYNGTQPRVYSNVDNVGNVTALEKQINSQVKTYFAVTAYDNAGNESGYSDEVNYQPGMAVVDTIVFGDSYACVQLRNTSGFNWRVYSMINGTNIEVSSLDTTTCIVVPVVDDWLTAIFQIEISDLDGNVVFQTSQSLSIPLTGDFNNDGRVGLSDLDVFAHCYRNPSGYKLAADFNQNNQNDLYDFYRFAQRYGRQK